MRLSRPLAGLTAGVVAATLIGALATPDAALARRGGGAMRLIDVDVGSFAGVPLNTVLEFKFSQRVAATTVHHGSFLIREENATATGFTKQVPGDFQVDGRVVRFFPRLSTHLRNPDSPTRDFYPFGSQRDDADENAGLQPGTNYEIRVIGAPSASPVRSTRRRPLRRTGIYRFTTAAATPKSLAYTLDTYLDAPPPGFVLSNPPDKVASAFDQYAKHGGTVEVANDTDVILFGNRVPLSAASVRQGDHVTLTLTERKGDPSQRKPVSGSPFVEQNFDTSKIVFAPRFSLPDLGVYALRVKKDVKDIQGGFDYRNNAERLRLRGIWEFLDTARTLSPGTPPAQLQNPPIDLIFDWPVSVIERGILKQNALALGDTYPDEIDPRVMVLFSTRDEPISSDKLVFEFVSADGLFDSDRSTAEYDVSVPGAASAIMTVAGGSAVHGDFLPLANTTLNMDTYPNNTAQFRDVVIPQGVTVTVTGTRPASILALNFTLNGTIAANGSNGQDGGSNSYYTTYSSSQDNLGGAGGPGGGDGARSAPRPSNNLTDPNTTYYGLTGNVGVDSNGNLASPEDGGRGGLGGANMTGSYYMMGGGGGGGGGKGAGQAGSAATYASWNSPGGAGGAGAQGNDDLDPLVGGAGGGSGGIGTLRYTASTSYATWHKPGAGGGGGGGGVRVQTARVLNISASGKITAKGGSGGKTSTSNSTVESGAGGGGGGGSIRLDSSGGFDISDPLAALDVSGGAGGGRAGNYAGVGGAGGPGHLRLSDPNGGLLLPGGTQGVFDPVGGGVPSFLYTLFADIGVDNPRVLNFSAGDFSMSAIDDAILIEAQFAIEDPANFGMPLLTALQPDGTSTDVDQVSQMLPIRYVDNTGKPTPAIPGIPGYDPGTQGLDVVFDIASKVAGKAYKFVRLRVTFQLDDLQSSASPLPFVDSVAVNFQFNF